MVNVAGQRQTLDGTTDGRRAADREGLPRDLAGAIVAFDFDGTLTVRDSFTNFLKWRTPDPDYSLRMAKLAPALAAYALHRDRGRLKGAAIRAFLRGLTRAELEQQAYAYATHVSRSLLRPDALMAWRRWREMGAKLVIVTASPELTVGPFAHALGADMLLGSRLVFDADDRVVGPLEGANCRGAEKVRRLQEAFGEDVRVLAAYGDTSGDRELLAFAEEPYYRAFTGRA